MLSVRLVTPHARLRTEREKPSRTRPRAADLLTDAISGLSWGRTRPNQWRLFTALANSGPAAYTPASHGRPAPSATAMQIPARPSKLPPAFHTLERKPCCWPL